MSEITPYFGHDGHLFEQRGQSNGGRFWSARDFASMLGYDHFSSFQNAINRAVGTCTTLGIPVAENFQQCQTEVGGVTVHDYRLSRFACYLVAMNGDVRKPEVAAAQAYFASLAEATSRAIQNAQEVERVQIRDDISERERSLSGVAKRAGVVEYAFFQSAGYRGMYNMDLTRLKRLKGLPDAKRSLLDFMGRRELVGNLFRITETEARVKAESPVGQVAAEAVAYTVGRKVRNMMIESDGTAPESLPLGSDIQTVRKGLKQAARDLKRLDKPATRPKRPLRSGNGP